MEDMQLQLDANGRGAFYLSEDGEQIGEMAISVDGQNLTVYHTEVSPKAEGKGYTKKLLNKMVEHARAQQLKVIPLCPYVHAQFKRHEDEYADVWNKGHEAQ
jgi:predicted GNAT family acetyltransferase